MREAYESRKSEISAARGSSWHPLVIVSRVFAVPLDFSAVRQATPPLEVPAASNCSIKPTMRIGILGARGMPLPGRNFGGFETFIGGLAPRLAERGHEVAVYCRRSL